MACFDGPYTRQLTAIVQRSGPLISALKTARRLGLSDWCIGAGAVRNLVWDALHGLTNPIAPADIDLAYFDATDLSAERDRALQAQLAAWQPDVPWEVVNQAAVHLWYGQAFGRTVPPLHSLEEALATWPEYATCVGVRLRADETIEVIAPHGLDDLFGLVVRHNPVRASAQMYRQRMAQKRFQDRWPRLRITGP
ncbi:MAG: nucleotidyltransferase family protein [Burkholderiaceae bacterium]|nr:nucleotidyltransferase family protein [Burkholderiaceae bacterium]